MLKFDAKNAKALFRYGEALVGSKDFEEAKKQFEAALVVAPNDKGINTFLRTSCQCLRPLAAAESAPVRAVQQR